MPSTDTNVHRAGLANPNLFMSTQRNACFVLTFEKEKTIQYLDFRVSLGLESYVMHCKRLPRSPLDERTNIFLLALPYWSDVSAVWFLRAVSGISNIAQLQEILSPPLKDPVRRSIVEMFGFSCNHSLDCNK